MAAEGTSGFSRLFQRLCVILQSMETVNWSEPRIIQLPKIYDPRGNLTFVQDADQIPFEIARVYWTYDVPAGEFRGGHSHREAEELVVATGGSFNVNLYDGVEWVTYTLNRPYVGLYIPSGYWRTLDNFASGSVCLVMTSTLYSEEDYVRDFDEFCSLSAERRGRCNG